MVFITFVKGSTGASGSGVPLANSGLMPIVGPTGPRGPTGANGVNGDVGPTGPASVSSNFYGSFSSLQTQQVTGANAPTVWTYDTTELSMGIRVDDLTKIVVEQSGVYEISYSIQLDKNIGGGPSLATIWARINGNDVPRSTSNAIVNGPNDETLPFVPYIFELNRNDYVEFVFQSADPEVIIRYIPTGSVYPETPSVIINAKMIATNIGTTGAAGPTGAAGVAGTIGPTGPAGELAPVAAHSQIIFNNSGSLTGASALAYNTSTSRLNLTNGVEINSVSFLTQGGANIASNLAIGPNALLQNISATNTSAVGFNALYSLTTGTNNTAVGYSALSTASSGSSNVVVGANSLLNAGYSTQNVVIGSSAMRLAATPSENNVVAGAAAMMMSTNPGANNVVLGAFGVRNAGFVGNQNIVVGGYAAPDLTSGSGNIVLGHSGAMGVTSGSGNVLLSTPNLGNVSNVFAVGSTNLYGTDLYSSAFKLGVNTVPNYTLDVAGTIHALTGVNIGGNMISSETGTLLVSANINPSVDSVYSLGSTGAAWKSIYVSTGTIFIGPVGSLGLDNNGVIYADQGFASPFISLGSTNPGNGIKLYNQNNELWYQNQFGASGPISVFNAATNSLNNAYLATGYLGINTPTPTYLLDVSGTGHFQNLLVDGLINAGGFTGPVVGYLHSLLNTGPAGATGAIGPIGATGAIGPQGTTSGIVYYLNKTGAMASYTGYYNLSAIPVADPLQTISSTTLSAGQSGVIANFITNIGDPAQTVIPGGTWDFILFASKTNTNHVNRIGVNLYSMSLTGSKTYIASSTQVAITSTSSAILEIPVTISNTYINITDRIGFEIVGFSDSNTSVISIYTQNQNFSHVHTTISKPSVPSVFTAYTGGVNTAFTSTGVLSNLVCNVVNTPYIVTSISVEESNGVTGEIVLKCFEDGVQIEDANDVYTESYLANSKRVITVHWIYTNFSPGTKVYTIGYLATTSTPGVYPVLKTVRTTVRC